ncbi:MAG: hypothetical protein AAFO15_00995 [Pseudomonadota bacterium]
MKILLYGFGNPGKLYMSTRHNIGMMFLNRFLRYEKINSSWIKKQNLTEIIEYKNIICARPLVNYNIIGTSIASLLKLHIDYNTIILIHDDLKLSLGEVKVNYTDNNMDLLNLDKVWNIYYRRSHYGNNALRSIFSHAELVNKNFIYIRIGTGYNELETHSDHVLGKVNTQESIVYNAIFDKLIEHLSNFIV